jgi:hypothetical protein
VSRRRLDSLEQYRVACHRFVRQNPWLPLASFGLTILVYPNKFGLAWLAELTLDEWRSEGEVPAGLRAHFPTSYEDTPSVARRMVRARTDGP